MLNLSSPWIKFSWVPVVAALLLGGTGVAQQTDTPATAPARAAPQEPPTGQPVVKPFRGRLPAYFAAVVSNQQRGKIYAVQAEYNKKLETLRMQINQLLIQRDKEVDSILSPEQLAEVNEKRKAAAARRKSRQTSRAENVDP